VIVLPNSLVCHMWLKSFHLGGAAPLGLKTKIDNKKFIGTKIWIFFLKRLKIKVIHLEELKKKIYTFLFTSMTAV